MLLAVLWSGRRQRVVLSKNRPRCCGFRFQLALAAHRAMCCFCLLRLCLLLQLVTTCRVLASACPTTCPPGFGIQLPCNDSSPTASCNSCVEGLTFSADDDSGTGVRVCKPCRECGIRGYELVSCNVTDDTLCGCVVDYFWDSTISRCARCTPCPHGQGTVKTCTNTEDTACGPCPNGTFSNIVSRNRGCQRCSKCNANQKVVQNCTRIQDTVCAEQEILVARPARRTPIPIASEDGGLGVLPVYCALLVAIVLAVLAYVALRQWLPTSGVNEEDQKTKALAETLVRDLPMHRRRQAEALLDIRRPDWRDWRGLALELGYSSFKIAQLEYKGRQRKGPMHHLMLQLAKRETFTVNQLVTVLICLGRMDVARVLQPNLEKPIGKRGVGIMV